MTRSPNYGRARSDPRVEPVYVLAVDTAEWFAVVGTPDGRRALIEGGDQSRLVTRIEMLKRGVWRLPVNARVG